MRARDMTERSAWTVLLVAHGTITDPQEIPAFLQEIRQGRPAPIELIEEMRARYAAIGGSPLLEQTSEQASALAARLGLPVRVAMRFSEPRVEHVLGDLGPNDSVCLLPAAPLSVPVYEAAARRCLTSLPHPPRLISVAPWAMSPPLIDHWAAAIRAAALRCAPPCRVLVTAHSLPQIVIDRGDRYQIEFEALARAVLAASGTPGEIAYQSQGASGGDWLGPSLASCIERAAADGAASVLVAPVGFLCEHVETLFDLDIEAKAQTEALGLEFARLSTPKAEAGLVAAMESAVRAALGDRLAADRAD